MIAEGKVEVFKATEWRRMERAREDGKVIRGEQPLPNDVGMGSGGEGGGHQREAARVPRSSELYDISYAAFRQQVEVIDRPIIRHKKNENRSVVPAGSQI